MAARAQRQVQFLAEMAGSEQGRARGDIQRLKKRRAGSASPQVTALSKGNDAPSVSGGDLESSDASCLLLLAGVIGEPGEQGPDGDLDDL